MTAPSYLPRLEAWLTGAGARLEPLRYPRPGGEAQAFRWIPAVPPRGRVLVAHGAGNDALFPLLALCKPLVRAGWEIFAFDLDGHGRASSSVYTPDGIRAALGAAADEASAAGGPLPVHLLGHSLGGSLALDALAAGMPVRSAAVVSAPLAIRVTARTALAELRGFLRPSTLSQREHYGAWGLVPAVGPLKRRAYPFRMAAGLRGPGSFGYVDTVQALLRELDLERRAASIRAPVLLVYGRGDALVPAEHGRRLAGRIPGAELLELGAESHWSLPWAEPAVRRVAAWLEEHA